MNIFSKKLNKQDLQTWQDINRAMRMEMFKADQIRVNIKAFPKGRGGQLLVETEIIARLLGEQTRIWISNKLKEYGFKANDTVSIDLQTGELSLTKEKWNFNKPIEAKNE